MQYEHSRALLSEAHGHAAGTLLMSGRTVQCLNEDVLSPMVACIRKMPRLMASEALAHLWPDKAPAGTDLAGAILGNTVLNTCRSCAPHVSCTATSWTAIGR